MFDFAFSELTLIAILTIIIIGPKRMPVVARMAGKIFGQVNRYVSQVKKEVEREMQLADIAELKKEFSEQSKGFANDVKKDLSSLENNIKQEVEGHTKELKGIGKQWEDNIKSENDFGADALDDEVDFESKVQEEFAKKVSDIKKSKRALIKPTKSKVTAKVKVVSEKATKNNTSIKAKKPLIKKSPTNPKKTVIAVKKSNPTKTRKKTT